MASVNQTRPHCVNQMGKARSKPLAARHGHGMLRVNRPSVDHKNQTEADVNAVRQVLVYMKEQLDWEIGR